MTLTTWFLFLVTEIALALTPGPAVLFVVGTGLRHGLRASIGANLGVLSGNSIYFLASALGLGLVIAKWHALFVVLKWCGAAYLVWLGVQAIRASFAPPAPSAPDRDADGASIDVAAASAARSTLTPGRAWRAALVLQLGNPKAIVFFTALVPQFVRPESAMPMPTQIAILGVTSVVPEFFVLLGYGALAARAAALARDPRAMRTFDRASGVCLIGCAALAIAA